MHLPNIFLLLLAFSPQDFTTIFTLKGSSEAQYHPVFFFHDLKADGCILINHGAFSLRFLALDWECGGREIVPDGKKKAQTKAKRINHDKDKCRKQVSPADFGGFKILSYTFQGKTSCFIPFSLHNHLLPHSPPAMFRRIREVCPKPAQQGTGKARRSGEATMGKGMVQGAASSQACRQVSSLQLSQGGNSESLIMSTYITSLGKFQAEKVNICGHLKCYSVHIFFCEQFQLLLL